MKGIYQLWSWAPKFLSLTAWGLVSETYVRKVINGGNLGEHRLV